MFTMRPIENVIVLHGILLNSLLLYLIFRYSKPQLGNYRGLLKIFACNDIFLVILNAIAQPASISSTSALGVFSKSYPDNKSVFPAQYIIALSCACFTIPFTLMNINFLHRYWTVHSPHKIELFSSRTFAAKLSLYPILMTVVWSIAALQTTGNSVGKAILQSSIAAFDDVTIGDGWLIMHYWENGHFHYRDLALLLFAAALFIINFFSSGVLCTLTIHHIKLESTFSTSYKKYQFKILSALFAQSAVPVLLVYIPLGLGLSLPLLHYSESKGHIDHWFTLISIFPALDAVVIILLMKDYRQGLMAMIYGLHKSEVSVSTWMSTRAAWNT